MTMTIIMLNAVTIAIETSRTIKQNNPALFSGLDLAFVTYYTVEVGLKLFASPYEFWLSGYNLVRHTSVLVNLYPLMTILVQ